jgi:hypothetical protein
MRSTAAAGLALMLMAAAAPAHAEAPSSPAATAVVAAAATDVASMDAIMAALYDVISGDAGQPRDWNRFRSLFWPGAVMVPTGVDKDGKVRARLSTPDDYVTRNGPYFAAHAFFERELARRTERFGAIAQVFSTYESRDARDAARPFERGINSIQLLNDGKRWWITSISWSGESPSNPLPPEYLRSPR